ncbi:HET-domain-containing protein [Lindgomyces ingoldianus]|uniref:HET-domain-containing protein n=1 Tax=Lindgomyces ingoldianus TaxID=673940 RepID=A0ACB6QZC0_9PLEO|nr:HET-domain-containing protein [Lindgomyces ingoldianus]KAF2472261.1 HET-domain-containing protein [Lindgomyces ingoldianus]
MTENFQEVDFGTITEIQSKRTCPVCRLVLCMLLSRPTARFSPQQQISPSPQRIVLRRMGRDGFIIWQDGVIQGELNYFFPNHQINAQSNWWFPFKDTACETPNTLDYAKVNRWITKCDSDHIHCKTAHSVRNTGPSTQTYFIDTFNNCLVYRDTSVRYLALSYVWGNAVMFKTTSSNCNALQQPGALLGIEPPLSPVVRDAIEVSRRLGKRYLWIDALCIPQDNEIEKAKLIPQMDSIYAQAFLTIISLSADSAQSPLPGVRQGTRLASIVAPTYSLYTRLLFDFSKRKLTYSEDSLKAISGMFSVFSSRFGWRFVAGMPSHLMSQALLWRSASPTRLRNPNFPSWSWAGWSGRSHWNFQNFMDPLWVESEIGNAPLIPLQSEIEILQGHNPEAPSSLDPQDTIRSSVLHLNVDSVQMSTFQILPRKPTHGQSDYISIAPYEEIWTMDGLRCSILYDFQGGKVGVHKFIALSRSRWTKEHVVSRGRVYGEHSASWFGHICDDGKLEFSEYCLVNVMLVVTKETKTERVGIGLVHNDVWRAVERVREHIELR